MRPSVLWINQFALLPKDGGGTRHFELGRELARRGWRVTVMASDLHLHRRTYTRRATAEDRNVIVESLEGVDLQWLWAASYQSNNWRRAWNWLTFSGSVKRAAASIDPPDIVIGSSPQLFAASVARTVAGKFGVPFVFEVRDLWPESLVAAGGKRGAAYYLLDRLAWSMYRSAEKILVLARGTRDYLVQRGLAPDRFLHVPNGVDVQLVSSAHRAEQGERNPERFQVVYAGAHGQANGLEQVLEAAELLRSIPQVQFLLVGDGPDKANLMAEARRRGLANVEFRGAVPKSELVGILAGSQAGLMILRDAPLFSFGVSPNKLFDYLAAELPVICNVPGEVAQMLAESKGGIQAGDSGGPALAEAVRRMMQLDLEARRGMGVAGRDWVCREHSREVLGERLDLALRALISSHSKS